MIHLYKPEPWPEYELMDCGGFEKLERFGKWILIRPEPQAVWNKILPEPEWTKWHHIRFKGKSATGGEWVKKTENIPDRWTMRYERNGLELVFRLGLTSFKHLGIFPEQSLNWDYIFKALQSFPFAKRGSLPHASQVGLSATVPSSSSGTKMGERLKFLNLFAYTGGSSLAAKAAGADVTHLDSIKQVLNWASDNQELSGLKDIRWVLEDAMKFVKREVKRGNLYSGIIMDPPAYGNGPSGEKWKLEDQIQELISVGVQLLEPNHHFLILNTYSLGFSSLIVENLLKNSYFDTGKIEVGELFLPSTSGIKLPLGVIGKIEKGLS